MIANKREFEPGFSTLFFKLVTLYEANKIIEKYKNIDKFTDYQLYYPDGCLDQTLGVLRERIKDTGDYIFVPIILDGKFLDNIDEKE